MSKIPSADIPDIGNDKWQYGKPTDLLQVPVMHIHQITPQPESDKIPYRLQKDLSKNLFYDSCAYDVNFLTAAIKQRGVDQTLFGTESPGSGGAVRPDTGRPSDDLVPVIDSLEFLTAEDKLKIFQKNPLRVFTKVKI